MHVLNPDHHIMHRGADKMLLVDHQTGEEVVTAERVSVPVRHGSDYVEKPMWIVGAAGVPNQQFLTRVEALAAMPHMAHESLGPNPNGSFGDGYITITPHGLADMP